MSCTVRNNIECGLLYYDELKSMAMAVPVSTNYHAWSSASSLNKCGLFNAPGQVVWYYKGVDFFITRNHYSIVCVCVCVCTCACVQFKGIILFCTCECDSECMCVYVCTVHLIYIMNTVLRNIIINVHVYVCTVHVSILHNKHCAKIFSQSGTSAWPHVHVA